MTILYEVLNSINSANKWGHADTVATLKCLDDIIAAGVANNGVALTYEQAEQVSKAGLDWINKVKNGDGEWCRYRDEAKQSLEGVQ